MLKLIRVVDLLKERFSSSYLALHLDLLSSERMIDGMTLRVKEAMEFLSLKFQTARKMFPREDLLLLMPQLCSTKWPEIKMCSAVSPLGLLLVPGQQQHMDIRLIPNLSTLSYVGSLL